MKRCLSLAALLVLAVSTPLRAQQHPNTAKGFNANNVYQFHQLDAVNQFNGNLTISIPIGSAYPVADGFSYKFVLQGNANIWEAEEDTSCLIAPAPVIAYAHRRANAGLGFILTLGRLYPPEDPTAQAWTYESPDGADHIFRGSGDVRYTQDGSYIRMKTEGDRRKVEFPDGSVHTFKPSIAGEGPWLLEKITNPYSPNFIEVKYYQPDPAGGEREATCAGNAPDCGKITKWVVRDNWEREHIVRFREVTWDSVPRMIVESIELSAFDDGTTPASCTGGTAPPSGKARYSFTYDDNFLLHRPDWHTSGPNICVPNTVRVSMLRSVIRPDCTSFLVDYQGGAVGDAGLPAKLMLPTGGAIQWTWQQYSKPVRSADILQYQATWGVATRKLLARDGSTIGTWTYTSVPDCNIDPITGPLNQCRELKATVVDPLGNKSEHFFAIEPDPPARSEYGKPFTRKVADASGTRWLSQRTRDAGGTLLRSTYVEYDDDTTDYTAPITDVNARVKSSRNVYEDDQVGGVGLYLDTIHSDFDGLGHYRTVTVRGTLAGTVERVTKTGYNPTRGTYTKFEPLPTTQQWITGMFDRVSTAENGETELSQYCSDAATGFLKRKRVLKNSDETQNAHDLVSVFTADSRGNVAREEHYGGDGASVVVTTSWCDQAPAASPVYRIDHTLGSDGVTTSRYVAGSSGQALTFFTVDDVIDLRTGLVKKSTDSSGVVTEFVYDRMGRLTLLKPSGAAWTKYTYTPPAGTAAATVSAAQYPNGQSSGTALMSTSWEFDGIGRPVIERQLMPDGVESRRETSYNALGWTTAASELGRSATLPLTTWTHDALGRVLTARAPDDSVASFAYLGVRRKTRTATVSMAAGATDVPVTATENYDAFGRLLSVSENSGPLGELVTTTYTYDVGGRLSSVTMTGASGDTSQNRMFDYDGRGFLRWESHAESGMKSYTYDARGHVLTSELGSAKTPFDLKYTWDAAERLVKLEARTPGNPDVWRPAKEFTWATDNVLSPAPADYRNGKLLTATRYNYKPDPDFSSSLMNDVVRVTETYAYRDAAGRRTHRTTTIATSYDGMSFWQEAKSFSQSASYDDLGQQSAIQYPMCYDCGTPPGYPPRNVTSSYSRGRPVAVSEPHPTVPGTLYNWVQSVSYWPNGMRNVLTHRNSMSDTQTTDSSGMARPGELKTEAYSVCKAPVITNQTLGDVRSAGGGAAHLSVTVSGAGPMAYQWFIASTSQSVGPNAAAFDVSPAATTSYYVTITNSCKSIRSKTMTVKVGECVLPWIEETAAMRNPNGTFNLRVGAVGGPPLSYTWRRLPDQTLVGTSFEVTTGVLSSSTSYEITVSNSCGTGETRTVQAYIEPPVAAMNISVAQAGVNKLNVTWDAVPGATTYVLSRRTATAGMAVYQERTSTSWPDENLAPDGAYAYMVTAYNTSNAVVGKSAVKAATTVALTSVSGGAMISAAPFDQMLRGVNAVRAVAGWEPVTWSNILSPGDPLPQPGMVVSSRHLLAIRARLNEGLQAIGVAINGFSDPDPQSKVIRALHITEIQGRLQCGKETCP